MRRYDRPSTLFFLDPPYWGSEGYYGDGFQRADFERLNDVLKGLQGAFIMSLNDKPEVREIFGSFSLIEVTTTYTVARSTSKAAAELLITNRPSA
jgi:DNA adenine methylase